MPKSRVETLEIEDIVTMSRMQTRAGAELDPVHLRNIQRIIDSGEPIELIDVFRVKGPEKLSAVKHVLVSGHYRLEVYRRKGLTEVEANVHEGTEKEAFAFSRGQNRHGKGRTAEDLEHAIIQAFEARKENVYEWFSDTDIAHWHYVSQQHVSKLRQEWEAFTSRRNPGPLDSPKPPPRRKPSPSANGKRTEAIAPPKPVPITLPDRPNLAVAKEQGAEKAAWLADAAKERKRNAPDPIALECKRGLGLLHLLTESLRATNRLDKEAEAWIAGLEKKCQP